MLSGLYSVIGRYIAIQMINVLCVIYIFYISYNTTDCICFIGTAAGALFVYMFVLTIAFRIIRWRSVVEKLLSRYGQCVYDADDGDGNLGAMFVNGDGVLEL